jgi:SAM-dependent methyltransferase
MPGAPDHPWVGPVTPQRIEILASGAVVVIRPRARCRCSREYALPNWQQLRALPHAVRCWRPAGGMPCLTWFAGHVSEDDPVTGRRMLTGSAYADDRHIRSRMANYACAKTAANPRWRTSVISWDGTQIVADVGCGNGLDLRQIVPQGRCRHAIGLDLSAGMLRSLEDLRQSGRLSLVQADAQRLPLPSESVDVAMAMHMLYHVPDIQAAVRELRRITRQGGTVLASTNSLVHLAEIHELLDAQNMISGWPCPGGHLAVGDRVQLLGAGLVLREVRVIGGLAGFQPLKGDVFLSRPSTGKHASTPVSSMSSRRVCSQRFLDSFHAASIAGLPRRVAQVVPLGS